MRSVFDPQVSDRHPIVASGHARRPLHSEDDNCFRRRLFPEAWGRTYCMICIRPAGVEYLAISSYSLGTASLITISRPAPSAVNVYVTWSFCISQNWSASDESAATPTLGMTRARNSTKPIFHSLICASYSSIHCSWKKFLSTYMMRFPRSEERRV